jgi:glutathione S-transferase
MTIKLYQFPISHYCEKVRWALDYKGLPFRKVNLVPGLHVRKTLSLSQKSQVPVIDDNGAIVQGSSAIIDYLDKTYPERPLTPHDPVLAEQALAWEKKLDDVVGVAVRTFVYHHLLSSPSMVVPLLTAKQNVIVKALFYAAYKKIASSMRRWMSINESTSQKAMTDMDAVLSDLRKVYVNTRYLVGDEFSRADLAACALFAPMFQPNGYGLKWPNMSEVPVEMTEWLASHDDALQSLAIRYEQNR